VWQSDLSAIARLARWPGHTHRNNLAKGKSYLGVQNHLRFSDLSGEPHLILRNGTSCTSHNANRRRCEKYKIKLDTQVTKLDMEVGDDGSRTCRAVPGVINRSE